MNEPTKDIINYLNMIVGIEQTNIYNSCVALPKSQVFFCFYLNKVRYLWEREGDKKKRFPPVEKKNIAVSVGSRCVEFYFIWLFMDDAYVVSKD